MSATIGPANAGAPAVEPALVFPLPTAGAPGASASRTLAAAASRRGARGARVFGHPDQGPWHLPEVVYASLAAGAAVLGGLGVSAGLWLSCALVVLCAIRAFGVPNPWLPRRPAWSVVLGPIHEPTAVVLVAVIDRERREAVLPRMVFGLVSVSLLVEGLGLFSSGLAAVALGLTAAWASWSCRATPPKAGSPEGYAADAVVRQVAADPLAVGVLAGASSAAGTGVRAVLDWYGKRPDQTRIELVGTLGAQRVADALTRAGWSVRVLSPEQLRSQG